MGESSVYRAQVSVYESQPTVTRSIGSGGHDGPINCMAENGAGGFLTGGVDGRVISWAPSSSSIDSSSIDSSCYETKEVASVKGAVTCCWRGETPDAAVTAVGCASVGGGVLLVERKSGGSSSHSLAEGTMVECLSGFEIGGALIVCVGTAVAKGNEVAVWLVEGARTERVGGLQVRCAVQLTFTFFFN